MAKNISNKLIFQLLSLINDFKKLLKQKKNFRKNNLFLFYGKNEGLKKKQ